MSTLAGPVTYEATISNAPGKPHGIEIVNTSPGLGSSFTLTLERLNPPTILANGTVQGGTSVAPALKPYIPTQSANDYESFLAIASREYVEFYGMNRELFDRSQAAKETADASVSIPWVAEATFASGKFMLVGKMLNLEGNKFSPPPNKVGITLLKWVDGAWKLFPVELAPEVLSLPFTDAAALQSIEASSKVRINDFGKMEPVK